MGKMMRLNLSRAKVTGVDPGIRSFPSCQIPERTMAYRLIEIGQNFRHAFEIADRSTCWKTAGSC